MAPGEVTVRTATPADSAACGALLFMTWPALYSSLLRDEDRARQVLASLFLSAGNTFSYETSRVAVLGGEVMGLLAAYAADEGQRRATASLMPALRALGPFSFLRVLVRVWRITEASIGIDPRHYYIANVAVMPEAQGIGVGRLLLGDAEQRARSFGRSGLSLEVDGDNFQARRFYEHAGYRIIESRQSVRLGAMTGSSWRMLMSKEI